MASTAMPPPPTSAAVPLYHSDSGSSAAAATAAPLASKKKEHLAAGRRKLEEYRKRKAEEKKSGERIKTDTPISENLVINVQPEERILDGAESFSVQANKSVFVNGPKSNILGELAVKARPLAGRLSAGNQLPESELHKEERNGKSSRTVESDNLLIEEARSNSEDTVYEVSVPESYKLSDNSVHRSFSLLEGTDYKLSTNDSLYRFPNTDDIFSEAAPLDGLDGPTGHFNGQDNSVWRESSNEGPAAHGSKADVSFDSTGYQAKQQEDLTGADGSILNEEGGNHKKRPFGNSSNSSSMKPSYNSLTAFPIQKKESAVTSVGMPALSFTNLQKDDGTFSLNIGQAVSGFQLDSYANANDMKPGEIEAYTDKLLSFVPSGTHSTFNSRETKPNFSFKPSDSSSVTRHSERDEFAALEQHIEDLTREKFSLQRALDTARSLAESLAQENSALTEDFNSQGVSINQLQVDLERQADQMKAQSLVLSSLMLEREKAQQESNSALERSQILAGEVIGLEEKVLKLRSNELKLERELEVLKSENDSYRGQLASLEKDRQNLRSMVEALQEEKKLFQGHMRKNLGSRDPQMLNTKGVASRESQDASTSTEDLGGWEATTCIEQIEQLPLKGMEVSNELSQTSDLRFEAASSSNSTLVPNQVDLNASPAVAMLPVDHLRTVNDISLLITELGAEKESFLKALKRESKRASELEALNAELSKKLEVQTQRLELVFAQNMAHGGTTTITSSNDVHQENEFVEEGDEVVDRVLGWIMRLFPSGSSKRRTSKLL